MIKNQLLSLLFTCLLATASMFSVSAESININTASVQQLVKLKGIGPEKAKAIVEYRKKNGKFKTISDLQNVSGIGQATVQKNQKALRLK